MNAKAAAGAAGAVLLLVTACGGSSGSPAGGAAKQPSAAPEVEGFSRDGWKTNFDKHSVSLSEISSGGPRKDGIPPLDHPKFVGAAEASTWLKPAEPVIALTVGAESRAYPMQILIWHEIVNDTVGGVPVTVTFCPLCYTAIAFDRRAAGRILDFGTTGDLRKSDLVMYDRQTESWWQQAVGRAIVGDLTGTQLTILPAGIVSWAIFRRRTRTAPSFRETPASIAPTGSIRIRATTAPARSPSCSTASLTAAYLPKSTW